MAELPFDLSKLNFSSIMDMARDLKEKMRKFEETLARIEVEAVTGGGMVTVKANARGDVISVVIDQELVEMKDKAMLENLVTSAVNQALAEAKKRREEETQKIAGGLGLPGAGLFT